MFITKNSVVVLTDTEQAVVRLIAEMRQNANRQSNVPSRKRISGLDDITIDLDGYGAEMAFARLCNVYPDFTTHLRSARTDTGDSLLPGGFRVDVKHTRRPMGNLITPSWKHSDVHFYALMVGQFPHFTFKGATAKEHFIKEENLVDLRKTGTKDTYFFSQEKLDDLQIPTVI